MSRSVWLSPASSMSCRIGQTRAAAAQTMALARLRQLDHRVRRAQEGAAGRAARHVPAAEHPAAAAVIVVPQLLVATVMGSILKAWFPTEPIWTLAFAASALLLAALAMTRVTAGVTR